MRSARIPRRVETSEIIAARERSPQVKPSIKRQPGVDHEPALGGPDDPARPCRRGPRDDFNSGNSVSCRLLCCGVYRSKGEKDDDSKSEEKTKGEGKRMKVRDGKSYEPYRAENRECRVIRSSPNRVQAVSSVFESIAQGWSPRWPVFSGYRKTVRFG